MAKVEMKQPIVDEIADNVKDAESVILVHYSGVSVETDTQMRKQLREAGITYKVYKNTMMRFAFKDTPYEPLTEHLQGPNAIAVSKTDATAPARIIAGYVKQAPELKMLAGVVEGSYYDENAVASLATIPSRDELLGRLFGSMQASIANLARVLKQIAEAGGAQAAAPDEAEAEAPAEAEAEAPAAEEAAPAEAEAEAPAAEEAAPAQAEAEAPAAEEATETENKEE